MMRLEDDIQSHDKGDERQMMWREIMTWLHLKFSSHSQAEIFTTWKCWLEWLYCWFRADWCQLRAVDAAWRHLGCLIALQSPGHFFAKWLIKPALFSWRIWVAWNNLKHFQVVTSGLKLSNTILIKKWVFLMKFLNSK